MRKNVEKTVTETQTFCDHCGNPVVYSEQACVVCGKVACHDCFPDKLVTLRLDQFPKFWPVNTGMDVFDSYSCPTCSNEITQLFSEVKSLTEERNKICHGWYRWYFDSINKLNKLRHDAEKAHNKL